MNTNKTVLHHYLGTGLRIISESGTKLTLHGLHHLSDDTTNYILENDVLNSRYIELKPALHSMNRLTMPLENGEIPILELAKIAFPDWEFELNKSGAIARKHFSRIFFYWCDTYFSAFDETAKSIDVPNQIRLIDYFHKKHFNLYGLSESEYIEKSTLKI